MISKILNKIGYGIYDLKAQLRYPYIKKCSFDDINFQIWIADEIASDWYDIGIEKNYIEMNAIRSILKENDSVLELGVHHGFYASFLCSNLNKGKYIGVELQPKCAMYAMSNLKLNDFPNAEVINAAAGSKSGTVFYEPFVNGNARISENSNAGFKTNVVTIDELADEYGNFSLLKIDVEGYEKEVLKGASNQLLKLPKLALEIHNHLLSKSDILEILDLIDINRYSGIMYSRPKYQIEELDIEKLIESENIVNVFLTPRE